MVKLKKDIGPSSAIAVILTAVAYIMGARESTVNNEAEDAGPDYYELLGVEESASGDEIKV